MSDKPEERVLEVEVTETELNAIQAAFGTTTIRKSVEWKKISLDSPVQRPEGWLETSRWPRVKDGRVITKEEFHGNRNRRGRDSGVDGQLEQRLDRPGQ